MKITNPELEEQQREVWWIYSPLGEPWAKLRIATFSRTHTGVELVVIHNEVGPRIGVRVWADIKDREHWSKLKQIEIPNLLDFMKAGIEP